MLVQKVLLLVHIGFVMAHYGEVSKRVSWDIVGSFRYLAGGWFGTKRGFLGYKMGGFLVQNGGFFGKH